ncbi:phage holin [Lactococcus garvieae]|nr:phage holin [Lactococcus garvieae]MBS4463518.1 phage holin [Lactococcus garvieae]
MTKINWKLRLLSAKFWLAFLPALLLMVQTIGAPFGYEWDFMVLNQQLTAIVNAVFVVLAIVGVVADPTTPGISDSEIALERENLKGDE